MTRRYVYDLFEKGGGRAASEGDRSAGQARDGTPAQTPREQKPLTVSQAVRAIRRQLESAFPDILVEGEISNFSRPASGHWYLTLKDDRSQLSAVMFARDNRRVPFEVTEGLSVVARGRITHYEGGGRTQLIVEGLEPAGLGSRALALRQLAERLRKEGLFDPARKQALPRLPRRLGVVTSRSGAALRDIIQVSQRRFHNMPIVVAPTRVQGAGADEEIAAALRALDASGLADAIIVGRGGGSTEDLEAFSSEVVVRAVAGCRTPTVSAVGHEIDTTLCDHAADARAPTPSAAAELVVPERAALAAALDNMLQRARQLMKRRIDNARLLVETRRGALTDPGALVQRRRQDLDRLLQRGLRALQTGHRGSRAKLQRASEGLTRQAPAKRVARARAEVAVLAARQLPAVQNQLSAARARLAEHATALDAMSPLAVLGRGYAIVLHRERAVLDAAQLAPGDEVSVRLARGRFEAEVRLSETDSEPD